MVIQVVFPQLARPNILSKKPAVFISGIGKLSTSAVALRQNFCGSSTVVKGLLICNIA